MAMPSTERYHGFINALRQNVRAFDAAEHDEQRLTAALAVLQGVVLYLHGDQEVMEAPYATARLARERRQ
jgi:hypothetical protein